MDSFKATQQQRKALCLSKRSCKISQDLSTHSEYGEFAGLSLKHHGEIAALGTYFLKMKILSRGPELGLQNHETTLKIVDFDIFYSLTFPTSTKNGRKKPSSYRYIDLKDHRCESCQW